MTISEKADAIGILALTVLVALLWPLAWSLHVPLYAVVVTYLLVAPLSLYVWHSERWPDETTGCLGLLAFSVVFGAMFFAVDFAISPSKGFPWVSSPFGTPLTLLVCPGLTLAAAGGIVRAYYLSRSIP